MSALPNIEDLYRRYSKLLESLFATYLPESDVSEAVNDTFATMYVEREGLRGMTEGEICAYLSVQAYEEFQRRLTRAPTPILHLIDATEFPNAISTPDEDGAVSISGLVLFNMMKSEQRDPTDVLTEEILSRDDPAPVDADLIAAVNEDNVPILSAYLSQAQTAQQLGMNLGQFLAPFSRPALLDPDGLPVDSEIADQISLSARAVSAEMLELLASTPDQLHKLTPRQFEEVVAELFAKQGYDVTLTATSRDGGTDLYVADNRGIGSFLYVVECKKYRPDRPVGVGLVRELFGVVQAARATAGILATTSYFTSGAKDFQRELQYQLSLRDYAALKAWLRD